MGWVGGESRSSTKNHCRKACRFESDFGYQMNMTCKKCKKDFRPQKGLKSFCSLACRNSRTFSAEAKKKKSLAAKKNWQEMPSNIKSAKLKKLGDISRSNAVNHSFWLREQLDNRTWSELGVNSRRRAIVLFQEGRCGHCGLYEWRGTEISFEIDHIDGNNSNHVRENLIALCPNCHSQTSTWRGRNKGQSNRVRTYNLHYALNDNFSSFSHERRRAIILKEQKNCCNHCGIDEWMSNSISLEMDHVDGQRSNNERSNLECLCPNCHSLTPTWRGRNRVGKATPVSDDVLIKAYKNVGNISKALRSVGLNGSGANHTRLKKLLSTPENL